MRHKRIKHSLKLASCNIKNITFLYNILCDIVIISVNKNIQDISEIQKNLIIIGTPFR